MGRNAPFARVDDGVLRPMDACSASRLAAEPAALAPRHRRVRLLLGAAVRLGRTEALLPALPPALDLRLHVARGRDDRGSALQLTSRLDDAPVEGLEVLTDRALRGQPV